MAVSPEEAEARRTFGLTLARLRAAQGLSQVDLRDAIVARGTAVSPSYVGMWEKGDRRPSLEQMAAVEAILGRPGLGLLLGVDTGGLAHLFDKITELEHRVAALEGGAAEAAIDADPLLDDDGRDYVLRTLHGERSRSNP